MVRTSKKLHPALEEYMQAVEKGKINACKEQHLLVSLVRKAFATETLTINEEQVEKYLSLVKYFPYEMLFPWEIFVLILHLCVFREDGMPRWPDLFMLIGRGAGKDGYIAFESFCLISPYNGIKGYDVDICANSELQAKAPFNDIYDVLDDPKNTAKLKRFFYWNKESITSLKTKSILKFRTNNPKGKDGLRSGIVIFNEIHQYQDYKNINVFTTGLGKKKHPRRTYATTNGDVRDGPLDDLVEKSRQILEGVIPDNGWLPFICKLDTKDEVHDPSMWEKANPSLPYRKDLRAEIAKEYEDWKRMPSQFTDFMTKRMNIPDGDREMEVTSWENIKACSETEIPDLKGKTGVAAMDYASINDFASAGILIPYEGYLYWITHSWLCKNSADIPRMKCPWQEWEKQGLLTVVDDVEINPELIVEWISEQAKLYHIPIIAMDNFRYALVAKALSQIGFSAKERKNIKLVRPSDIMIVSPIIASKFAKNNFAYGDNPLMRWAINNTKMIRTGINRSTGNMTYGKIEGKSRKTDPFMAMVAAMTILPEIGENSNVARPELGVWTF